LQKHNVLLEKRACKQLEKLSEDVCNRIMEVLYTLREEGFSGRLNIKKLQGLRDQYRLRIGRYGVLFELRPGRTMLHTRYYLVRQRIRINRDYIAISILKCLAQEYPLTVLI